ncbi:serine hydrolase domain-containing protein [Spirillospora sp. CA-253888]
MAEIHGVCDERFGAVREALAASLDREDVGASAAVYLEGEPVVDLWGGHADAGRTRPWERDTLVNCWSITKTMTALCALVLADRGELDLHAPVARYWPEFAAAGKERVEVRHLLSHTAGLPTWDAEPMATEDLYDWDKATSVLANGGAARGVRLLSEAGCQRVLEEQSNGRDRYLGFPLRFGMGYGLRSEEVPISPNPRACFWGGWGGSLVVVDLDARMCVSYVMNRMVSPGTLGDDRGIGIVLAAYVSMPA